MEEGTKEISGISKKRSATILRRFLVGAVFIAAGYFYCAIFVPVPEFPVGVTIEIPSGTTLSDAAQIFEERGVIRSAFVLRAYFKVFENGKPVMAGFYLFPKEESLRRIAGRLTGGEFLIERKKILITEGEDVIDVADTLYAEIPTFNKDVFVTLARKDEGYLFPDTYFFFTTVSPKEARDAMYANFEAKIQPIQGKISKSGRTLSEIVIMASIIEREAVTPEDRRIISGILWKRIKIGMPLQVDAAFDYVNGKTTHSLTLDDLNIDSPYNTYEYKGLPPGPICNPGLDTIIAAAEPKDSPYLYYLSDKDGKMHYAKNFEEHKRNKLRYL